LSAQAVKELHKIMCRPKEVNQRNCEIVAQKRMRRQEIAMNEILRS